MKETKTFFGNDNRLNKGYAKLPNQVESNNNLYRKKFEHLLPPIDLMEEYENLNPGTLAKLIDMAQKEQIHRHSAELLSIKTYASTTKLGKIFALIFTSLVCVTTLLLVLIGGFITAIVFAGLAFSSVIAVSFLQYKRSNRKRDYENSKHTNFLHKKRNK